MYRKNKQEDMKIRKFILITINDVILSLGKSMMHQGGIVGNTYDQRIAGLEMNKRNIEENFDQVIEGVQNMKCSECYSVYIK